MKLRRIILFLLLFAFLFLVTKKVFAWPGEDSLEAWERSVYSSEFNLQSHTNETLKGVINSLNNQILGPTSVKGAKTGGALQGVSSLITALYANPPASGVQYLADLGKNLGIVKPAYAQGIGFSGLSPILPLWKAFRNIAYLFFTIVFIVIGFAIMFRVKISPQAVMTIQSALPRIVMALILVTFSYAIAGFLIDLMYVLIGLGVLVLGQVPGWTKDIAFEQQKYMGLSFGEGIGLLLHGGVTAIWTDILRSWLNTGPSGLLGILADIIPAVLGGAGAILATLLLLIIALYVIIKLFFSLLQCYITIVLLIIFSPLQIMLGVLPNSQMGFGSWLKNLLANILVFPAVSIFILLGWVLATEFGRAGPKWTPPVISVAGEALPAIIALGMLLMIHKVPDIIKEGIFKIKPSPYGAAIGEAVGFGAGATRAMVEIGYRETDYAKGREVERGAKRKEGEEKYLREQHPDWYTRS